MTKNRWITAVVSLALLSSCGGPRLYSIKEHNMAKMGAPAPNSARVVFFRSQSGFVGQGILAIYDGNELIGGLSGTGYFVYEAEPGEHVFGCYSDPPSMDFLKANIDGGKTYHAQCSFQDRVLMLASKFVAIKKGSDRMENLDNRLSSLEYSILTQEGVDLYTVKREAAGNFIVDTRAAMTVHRIDIDRLRDEWLERAKIVRKPELKTADGR